MLNYMRDPDVRVVLESGFTMPPGLDAPELERLREFIRFDRDT